MMPTRSSKAGHRALKASLLLGALALLAACGERAGGPPTPAAPTTSAAPAAPAGTGAVWLQGTDRPVARLPRGTALPPERYQAIDATGGRSFSGPEVDRQRALLRSIYWSRAAFDAPRLAADLDPAIAREHDSFKRADLAAARAAEITAAHQAAAAYRHVAVLDSRGGGLSVLPHDAASGGFRVNVSADGGKSISFAKGDGQRGNWRLSLVGVMLSPGADGAARHQLVHRPANEAQARQIEAEVAGEARGTGVAHLPVRFYGEVIHAGEADLDAEAIVRVDAIEVLARDGQTVLMRFDRQALGDTIDVDGTLGTRLGAR